MQEFQYKMLEDETFAVTGYSGEEKEVVIPDTHWGKPVTVLFDSLFSGHAEIESIQIPDTVTDIGEFVLTGARTSGRSDCLPGWNISGHMRLSGAELRRSSFRRKSIR